MKKIITVLLVTGFVLSMTPAVMAGGIVNKQNFSAEYLRTFSRNATIDSVDAIAFNPAGVTEMEDGIYGNLGIFYAMKDYSNNIGGKEYSTDEPSIVPGLFGLYKKDKWAAFGALTIPAGGGKVEYASGNATTMGYGAEIMAGVNLMLSMAPPIGYSLPFDGYDTISSQSLEAESIYYGFTAGGAYEINDILSISLGLRFISATKEARASMTISPSALGATVPLPAQTFDIDYEDTADGLGGFIGLSITPDGPFNIGLRFETKTKLDFETEVNRDDTGMLTNGAKVREDLPGLFGLGIGYRVSPEIKIDTSFTYYLEENANREAARFQDVGNGYDLAVALEYAFNPKLKGSLGYMITNTVISPDDMTPEAAELDATTMCGGLVYEYKPGFILNFSLMRTTYGNETTSSGVELDKEVMGIGCGIEYRFK